MNLGKLIGEGIREWTNGWQRVLTIEDSSKSKNPKKYGLLYGGFKHYLELFDRYDE